MKSRPKLAAMKTFKNIAFPAGKRVEKMADTPFINLAILFNDSYITVFTDLH
jgi:hypothetical protein